MCAALRSWVTLPAPCRASRDTSQSHAPCIDPRHRPELSPGLGPSPPAPPHFGLDLCWSIRPQTVRQKEQPKWAWQIAFEHSIERGQRRCCPRESNRNIVGLNPYRDLRRLHQRASSPARLRETQSSQRMALSWASGPVALVEVFDDLAASRPAPRCRRQRRSASCPVADPHPSPFDRSIKTCLRTNERIVLSSVAVISLPVICARSSIASLNIGFR